LQPGAPGPRAGASPPPSQRTVTPPAPRVAAVPRNSGNGGGGYLVQISSQRSESDARASFRALQGKYPKVLNGRQATVRRADLGTRGVYYRAMVGPFGSAAEANQLCRDLKAAGGQCIIQRN
ncbi:MAG: SPOR domain-containing protein, partial [Xanthobacteraceae bacterium]